MANVRRPLLAAALLLVGAWAMSVGAPAKSGKRLAIGRVAQAPAPERRWALVIGVGRYVDPSIPSISFCVRDAHDLSTGLREIGYETLVLADDAKVEHLKPLKNNILVQAQRFVTDERIGRDDVMLVYFSGHGFATEDGAYLAASDTYERLAEATGLRVAWLRDLLKSCRASKKVLVLDSCHSGAGKGTGGPILDIASATKGAGMVTLASCRGDQRSWELRGVPGQPDGANSAYTHFLLKGLRGAADRDRDGEVALSELNRYLYDQVTAWARQANLEQTPVMNPASIEGEIVLSRTGPRQAVATAPAASQGGAASAVPGLAPQPPGSAILTPNTPAQSLEPGASPDDGEMILVPEGEFTMGSNDGQPDEAPAHSVRVPAFWIDKCEVTNKQYARFLNAVGRTQDASGHELLRIDQHLQLEVVNGQWRPRPGMDAHPVVNVSWYGAQCFALWARKRLPTEAEWEMAARGTDRRRYPWGDEWDPLRCNSQVAADGFDGPAPVGSFPKGASSCGCLDMAGNVWEWTSSLYRPYPYDLGDGRESAEGVEARVLRGGSWNGDNRDGFRATLRLRGLPYYRGFTLGFRCARSA